MKIQKNKIVFVAVMVCVVLFITIYGLMTFGKAKKTELEPDRIPMPDLDGSTVEYESKMEALDAIREERDITAPQLYPDHMVDDKGYFNPDYMEYEKQRIIDSLYMSGNLRGNGKSALPTNKEPLPDKVGQTQKRNTHVILDHGSPGEMVLEHQLFFASHPKNPIDSVDMKMEVRVDGTQTVREGQRLAMRVEKEAIIHGKVVPRNTQVFGFVKIRPNRVLMDISLPVGGTVQWVAHDLRDGKEGVYIENRLIGEMGTSAVDGMIGQVNLPGVPQISDIRRIFQRKNQRVKVILLDNYQMTLKPQL